MLNVRFPHKLSDQTAESYSLKSSFTIQLPLTIAGVMCIPGIFLHFSWDVSPFSAAFTMDYDLWQIAWPAFLPVPVAIVSLRWLFRATFSFAERLIAFIAGAISAGLVCFSLLDAVANNGLPTDLQEWLSIVIPAITLVLKYSSEPK